MLSASVWGSTLRPTPQSTQTSHNVGNKTDDEDDEKDVRLLEPGQTIKRELAGNDIHTYQIRLSAGQFLKVIVEQQGIDIVAQLSGPDGEQIAEFDREGRSRGREEVLHVAEAAGQYRLTLLPRQKNVSVGGYEVRIDELRAATVDDLTLHEARKLLQKGLKLLNASKYEDALPLVKRSCEIRERVSGPESRDLAEALNSLARIYWIKGEYTQAEELYQRSLAIREKILEPEHPGIAIVLHNLAILYVETSNYAKAEVFYQRALEIMEKALGVDHPNVATCLNNLALVYWHKGDYAKAESLHRRALTIREKALGVDHPDVAASLNNLANLHYERGEYPKAEPLFRRALEIMERTLGPDHSNVASSLDNLASVYTRMAEYAKAEPLHRRALAIREKTLGLDHPDVAKTLNNIAIIHIESCEYLKAEQLYRRSLAIREKSLVPNHPDIAIALKNLGQLYRERGDYLKAEQFYQRALSIEEKALGVEHIHVASTVNSLAMLHFSKGEFEQAEQLLQRELAIWEKSSAPDHPEVAICLNDLAILYRDRGDYPKAESLFYRALAIREKALGPDHPRVAYTLNDLAMLYRDQRDYLKAEQLFQRALAIREKSLRLEHPEIAASLDELAVLYAAKGDLAQAIKVQARANSITESNLTLNLAAGSERQKLAYLALFSKETDFTLSLHSRVAPDDPRALNLAFTTLLSRKGRGLDNMADTVATLRRHATSEDQALFDQLARARSQLAALTLRESETDKPQAYRARLKSLGDKVEELESTLSMRSAEFRAQKQPVTLAAVQAALPAGSALVEFAAYTPRDPRNNKIKLPPRYLTYLLAAQGQPRWIDLGETAPIDRAINAWRLALRDPRRTDVTRLARVVNAKVMQPVLALAQSELGETHRLLIAPDGLLNLVPFAALVDRQGRYLIESYSISYLLSGRDLLRLPLHRLSRQDAVVVADPDYGEMEGTVATKSRDVGLPPGLPQSAGTNFSLANIYFPPLKGTGGEAQALKTILPWATIFTREQATEAALKQLHSPSILHIATHGFFLQDQELRLVGTRDAGTAAIRSGLPPGQLMENPLLRSGLALAGANLRQGQANQEDDGILTALEAASLDLWGTKLVVLSACDTGVGEVKNGEGVYGLRRALVLAGSQTQVMSLWPVSDLGTRDLMIKYYKALQCGEGRGDGLRQVQLETLKRKDRRHPFYWASFIQSGEWVNLEGKR